MLAENGQTTATISRHVAGLKLQLIEAIRTTPLGQAQLLNPPSKGSQARFLAFRSPLAQRWSEALKARHCITDVRADVLRVGLALYHDEADVTAFAKLANDLPRA
jgi:selenocysteine lyase/cysteine desulfurase